MRQPRIDRWTALLAAIGALGVALVLLRVAVWGPGAAADGAGFVSAARNLLAGHGLVSYTGAPLFRDVMPGFPLTLALIGLFGPDPLDAAGYLHAAAFGATVFAVALWVRSRTRSRFLAVWAGLACACSLTLGEAFSTAMTEPLFICFTTLSLFALDRYLGGGGRSLLLAAAVCAALACATRYIGFALVAGAVPLLLLSDRRASAALLFGGGRGSGHISTPAASASPLRHDRMRGAARAALFAAVALAPVAAWMLHNVLAFGAPRTGIAPTGFSPTADLHTATGEFARWTLGESGFAALGAWSEALTGVPAAEPSAGAVLVRAAPALVLLAVAAGAIARAGRGRRDAFVRSGLAVPAAFLACYAVALAVALASSDAALYARYLAPMYPPLLVAAVIALAALLRRASRRGPLVRLPRRLGGAEASLPALALAAALALWLPQQALATLGDVRDWRAAGWGDTSRETAESATVQWLRAHPPQGVVWTTYRARLYLAADWRDGPEWEKWSAASRGSAELRGMPFALPDGDRDWIAEARADDPGARFVWFHADTGRGYGFADFAALPGLELEALLEDGAVFRLAADPAARGLSPTAALLEGARLLAGSVWALHLDEARNRLVYVREDCAAGDTEARFFLHVYPSDPASLPEERSGHGFDNLDFGFRERGRGFEEGGRCAAVRALPAYRIASIRTGQWVSGEGELWSVEVSFGE